MVVLDSFPFQEDSDVQYLGGVRRYAHSGGHSGKEIYFNSPAAFVGDSGNYLSAVHQSRGQEKRIEHSQGYMEGVENSQGYMKCRLCPYQTKIESLLRRHVVKHSLDSDFRCPACDFRENDPSKFVDHIGTHQSGKLVRCCFCPKKMTRAKMKSHVRIHRAVELYDCSMCQFSTNYEKTIKSHMDVYHTKEYSCHQCNLVMTKHELHWHMKFVHSMEPPEMAVPEPTVPMAVPAGRGTNSKPPKYPTKVIPSQSMFSCKFGASKIWKTSIALKMQKHVAKKQFNCGKCDYKTAYKKLLRTHRAKHSLDNSLVCTKCGFRETGPGKFATHLSLHSPNDLLECCFCGFQTPTRGTMSNHVSKHKPVPMFDCSECEFSAKRPASVRMHTSNVHRKKSRCTFCGVEMSRFAMLDHRKECHSGKGPNPEAGPLQSLESEQYDRDEPVTNDFNQQDENTVSCEFCNKPYAKSYVRKHAKKCRIENAPDPETGKSSEFKDISPELLPTGRSLANDVAPVYPCATNDVPESDKPQHSGLLQSQSINNKPKKPHLRCNSCFFKTTKKRLLKKHALKHFIDFRLTCPECGHKELSSFKFAHHLLQHGSDPDTFQCCFCSLSAPTSKRSYCAHLELHRPVNIFDCPKCEYSSNRADTVRNHCKNNHFKNRKCPHCGEVMSKARLIKHLLESHGELRDVNFKLGKADEAPKGAVYHPQKIKPTEFNSGGIGQSTSQCQNLDKLQDPAEISRAEHNPGAAEMPQFETDQDFFKCTKCTFKTKIQSLIFRHISKHLVDVPFVCPLCGFEHMSSRKFANHWDKHDCNAKKKIYQCCFCDVEIKKKNCLKAFLPQHIEEHRPVALHDCSECEFSSHSRYELDKHFKNQHVKKCECLLCGEVMTIFEHSFHTECKGTRADHPKDSLDTTDGTELRSVDFTTLRRRSAEVQESLIAALEDPASLIDAGPSSFSDGSSTIVQPALRPNCVTNQYMRCSSCDYKTRFKSLLKRHVLKHLIDVPFSCKKCSFSSFDERTFAEHIFTHTNSYKCHFCSYRAVNAAAAARHFSSHKVLAMQDCPECEYTSTYKYRLVEHLKGKHFNVPRCSYCGQKMSKDELYSHEKVCGRSLRSKMFGQSKTSREIPVDRLRSPQVPEGYESVEATSNQVPGLIDEQQPPVEQMRAMKGLLLHQLNLTPTQGPLGYGAKNSEIQSGLASTMGHFGSSESYQHTDENAMEITKDSVAVSYLSSQNCELKHPAFQNSIAEISTLADRASRVIIDSNSASVMVGQDVRTNDSVYPASLAEMSSHTDDVPAVIQEMKSFSCQNLGLEPTSTTETSTLADRVPAAVQESNSAAFGACQDPGLVDSVCPASSTETSSPADDVPAVTQEVKSVSSQGFILKHSSCPTSTTETSTLADLVPAVVQEPDSAVVGACQDHPGLIDSVRSASLTEMSSHTDDITAVIQEVEPVSGQNLGLKQPVCPTYPAGPSTLADPVPAAVQETNSAAFGVCQDPSLIDSVCPSSLTEI